MSEYLSKKAVLEWLNENAKDQDWPHEIRYAFKHVREKIQSSAFDADDSEVQRLRAALVEIKQLLNENRENDGAFQSWNHMQAWKVATQALSTTREPTNKYFGAEWLKAEGDENDA